MNLARARNLIAFVFLVMTSLCAVLYFQQIGAFRPLDRFILDQLQAFNRSHYPKPAPPVVIVGLDESFLNAMPVPLSLSHFELADALQAISAGGARVIGMDLVLPEKRFDQIVRSDRDSDTFHKALLKGLLKASRQTPVVTGKVWDAEHNRFRPVQVDYLSILKQQRGHFSPYASALFCADSDGRVRAFPGADCQPDGTDSGLALEMLHAAGFKPLARPDGLINYQIGQPFRYIPMGEVLRNYQDNHLAWLRNTFEGKPVLIGSVLDNLDGHRAPLPIASWLGDRTLVPGVLVHGQILRSLMAGALIHPLGAMWSFVLMCVGLLAWCGRSGWVKAWGFVLVVGVSLMLNVVLLQKNMWFAPAGLWVLGTCMAVARVAWDGMNDLAEKKRLRAAFGGYVSPPVLDEILSGRLHASQGGVHCEVCVLFSDIRGFTTLSEAMPAAEVVALLNHYFARMTRIVHKHQGTVDKFIGDGLMAFFGAPNSLPNAPANATACALEMLQALAEINAERESRGQFPLKIGIGLHAGAALVGHIGSPDRYEYTAIGDTINVASRVEGLCKDVGSSLLCTARVADSVASEYDLSSRGHWPLKGHSDMEIFEIKGPK
ncbi:adenylate/guanylate cyclase domain-containing protein [Limnobacter sp.]|uniref:adenylate/guanylate cyclase domain-containing protein n=1 Tax=Limnobacter sp. TaxID=2003368 RepID=UPI00258EF86E|nr:adenylate/guanylate cyclase domain-containing protein [Limnobacter sp.]